MSVIISSLQGISADANAPLICALSKAITMNMLTMVLFTSSAFLDDVIVAVSCHFGCAEILAFTPDSQITSTLQLCNKAHSNRILS